MAIIWPLRTKLSHPAFNQQRPVSNCGLLPPTTPVNLPWNAIGRPGLRDTSTEPRVVHQLMPPPAVFYTISGQTKDSTSTPIGNCTVELYETARDLLIEKTTSNGDGYYYFKGPASTITHYVVAYKAGSPDVAGTTVNTLTGT